jgi:hypothetical protein
MELINKPLKILPLVLIGFLGYKVYNCPCDKLLSCDKWVAGLAIGLGLMIVVGYPLTLE